MAARYGDVFFLMQQQGETSHNFILGFLFLGSLPSRVMLTRQSRLQRAILPCRGRLVPPPLEAGRVRARHAPEAAHAPAEGHAPAHAAPKHRRVDVVHVDAAHAAAAEAVVARAALVDLLQGPARVVLPPLLRVRQHRVGLAHQLELLLRLVPLLRGRLVGVFLERGLAVRLLDVAVAGATLQAQQLVVVQALGLLQLQLGGAQQVLQAVGVGVDLLERLIVGDGLLELLLRHLGRRAPQVRLPVALVPLERRLRVRQRVVHAAELQRRGRAVAQHLHHEDGLEVGVRLQRLGVQVVGLLPPPRPEGLVAALLAVVLGAQPLQALLDGGAALGVAAQRLLKHLLRHLHVAAQVERPRPQLQHLRRKVVAVVGEVARRVDRLRGLTRRDERLHVEQLRALALRCAGVHRDACVPDGSGVVVLRQRLLPRLQVRLDLLRLGHLLPEGAVAGVGRQRGAVLLDALLHLAHAQQRLGGTRDAARVGGVHRRRAQAVRHRLLVLPAVDACRGAVAVVGRHVRVQPDGLAVRVPRLLVAPRLVRRVAVRLLGLRLRRHVLLRFWLRLSGTGGRRLSVHCHWLRLLWLPLLHKLHLLLVLLLLLPNHLHLPL
mmetsp:Transcript_30453/g.78759  ORF Transcript_30453/g.78759 Transcript_30453/m.78759 type:complete len:605 (-) Transcript_30453:114-1928(-)